MTVAELVANLLGMEQAALVYLTVDGVYGAANLVYPASEGAVVIATGIRER